jgi:hypothetical protein
MDGPPCFHCSKEAVPRDGRRGLRLQVIFEDIILVKSCLGGVEEMWEIARQQASLEALSEHREQRVKERTA